MSDHAVLLTAAEAAGLLKRAMPGRDVVAWLAADRRYAPMLPPVIREGALFYFEADVLALARKLDPAFAARGGRPRRLLGERRLRPRDRRQQGERRARLRSPSLVLERRLALRPDRRADLDRRIRGWVDRRCIPDRRKPLETRAKR